MVQHATHVVPPGDRFSQDPFFPDGRFCRSRLLSTRDAVSPSHPGPPLDDLASLTEFLADSVGSESWWRARSLAGPEVSRLAAVFVFSRYDLHDAIRRSFCPLRLRAADPARGHLQAPDVAVRAVGAHAVLGRFAACLARVAPRVGVSVGFPDDLPFDDLLECLVLARHWDSAGGSFPHHVFRGSEFGGEVGLFAIVLREAAARLGLPAGHRLLRKRVRKHLSVFQWLVDAARQPVSVA